MKVSAIFNIDNRLKFYVVSLLEDSLTNTIITIYDEKEGVLYLPQDSSDIPIYNFKLDINYKFCTFKELNLSLKENDMDIRFRLYHLCNNCADIIYLNNINIEEYIEHKSNDIKLCDKSLNYKAILDNELHRLIYYDVLILKNNSGLYIVRYKLRKVN